MTSATAYTGVTRTFTSTVAPAATDIVAAKSLIDGATGFLLTSKYTADKNQVASGNAGAARTDAVAGKMGAQTTNMLATGSMVSTEKFTWALTAVSTDALSTTQLALVKTGMKTTFAAVYTKLAAELNKATVTDMSAGSLSLAAAAAGITALAMAF